MLLKLSFSHQQSDVVRTSPYPEPPNVPNTSMLKCLSWFHYDFNLTYAVITRTRNCCASVVIFRTKERKEERGWMKERKKGGKENNIVYVLELRWHGNNIVAERVSGVGWSGSVTRVIRKRSTSRLEKPSAVCLRWGRTAGRPAPGSEARSLGSRWRCWRVRAGAAGAGTARACRGSAATRTWTEPRRDFRLCRWRSRSPARTGSRCSVRPAARGSPSASYSSDGLGTSAATDRSEGEY